MWTFLQFFSVLGFILFLVLAFWSVFKKTGKGKRNFLYAAGCFILFVISASLNDSPVPQKANSVVKTTNTKKEAAQKVDEKKEKEQEEVVKKETEQKEDAKIEEKSQEESPFETYSSHLPGKYFIKEAKMESGKGNIVFYDNYALYIADNPDSKITGRDHKLYFDTGDGLNKALFEPVSYLFDKIPDLNQLSVEFPYDGKKYSYDVKREEIAKFIDADPSLRDEFMSKFVKVN